MADIGLYYPDVFVQDEAWLKAAALYWPRLARLMPRDYPQHDSPTARILADDLGFFVDVDPEPYAKDVGNSFLRWLERDIDRFEQDAEQASVIASLLPEDQRMDQPSIQLPGTPLDLPFRWIHYDGSIGMTLPQNVIERGITILARDEQGRRWLRMERHLGQIYVSALAHTIAAANDMPTITDQQGIPEHPQGWGHRPVLQQAPWGEVTSMYAVLALNTVLPADLGNVPVERIVRTRRAMADEFNAFRHHLDSFGESFAELGRSEDPAVLRARLELAVNRDIRNALKDLERGLRSQRLEPVRAVFSLKTPEVPVALSVLGTTFVGGGGVPKDVLDAGAIAACFVSSARRALAHRSELRRSPAGYLLGLRKELNPHGLIDRLRNTARRGRSEGY